MSRIFVSLSVLPVVLVLVTMAAGWWIGDYNGAFSQYVSAVDDLDPERDEEQINVERARLDEPHRRFAIHFQLGVASALTTVLINSLSVTYLIGTSRWVKEVCEAYELDMKYDVESTLLKRRTFPWSIIGVASILAIVALGAAADPGTGWSSATTTRWVTPHMVVAIVGTLLIAWAIVVQSLNLHRNAQIIDVVAAEVQRERQARGLPVE